MKQSKIEYRIYNDDSRSEIQDEINKFLAEIAMKYSDHSIKDVKYVPLEISGRQFYHIIIVYEIEVDEIETIDEEIEEIKIIDEPVLELVPIEDEPTNNNYYL